MLTVYPPRRSRQIRRRIDVSALQFYTLEGSVWRNEDEVRDRLKETLTSTLADRALKNSGLVREVAGGGSGSSWKSGSPRNSPTARSSR